MMRSDFVLCLSVCLGVLVAAVEVVFVTDLSIFASLAPCAQSALSYNVGHMTYEACPGTDLQSCVCTKNQNLASVATGVSKSISYSCGRSATEDQASAATVLSAYCNQGSIPAFPTPATPVSVYITDIPEVAYLAPCASHAVSEVLQSMSYALCPPDATALATCACNKNQNSLLVSQLINSSARYSCASHTADVSSAQAVFAAYCALNNGTTSFPTPTNPPGDMSYYVTGLTQYAALAPCAASGLSYAVLSQTYKYCPDGPQALASCACIKDAISGSITSSISSNVKYSCASTATEDISSAMAVFDFYCSAARAEVSAGGVVESVAQTSQSGTRTAAQTGAGVTATGSKPTSTGTRTGTLSGGSNPSNSAAGGTGSPDGTGSSGNTGGTGTGHSSTAAIVGGVVGGIVGLAALGILLFFLIRRSRKKHADALLRRGNDGAGNAPDHGGKPELAGNPVNATIPPSPSSSKLKANTNERTHAVSPVSAHGAWTPPPPNQAELHGHAVEPPSNGAVLAGHGQLGGHALNTSELAGQPPGQGARPELTGHSQNATYQQGHDFGLQSSTTHEAYGQPLHEMQGMHQHQQPVQSGHSRPVAEHERQLAQQQQNTGWDTMAELDGNHPAQHR